MIANQTSNWVSSKQTKTFIIMHSSNTPNSTCEWKTNLKLTKPTTAEISNLTQSMGVNPGFFFSGCDGTMNRSQVLVFIIQGDGDFSHITLVPTVDFLEPPHRKVIEVLISLKSPFSMSTHLGVTEVGSNPLSNIYPVE